MLHALHHYNYIGNTHVMQGIIILIIMCTQSNMKIRCKKHQASIKSVRDKLDTARKRLAAEKSVS